MKKLAMMMVAALGVSGVLASCGPGADAGKANVAACNRWKSAVSCDTLGMLNSYNCDTYEKMTCDISAYFDCMAGVFVCKDGSIDATKVTGASACVSKAQCK